ncbi:unnamed protein product [Paramecium sonneborni]|uniref:Uncharacterized protein n=1 Tax=Paramecium sonneborni TaxID=65129 RepID=A0A8S1MJJ0_9CILI|nr:unnamed protein product [Paramecium sonneborni]
MPYSFKLLVHDVQIQITDPILISSPSLSFTIANYPKIIINGKSPISNIKGTYDQQKSFGHGKSILLHLSQDKMTDILREMPLEILFLNGQAIVAGARINLEHFIPDIDSELKFKRGNFHLLDHFGKTYILADISISIHDPDKIPDILKEEKERQNQMMKLKQQQNYLQSLDQPNDPEPVPDQIVYNKKQKQDSTPKIQNSYHYTQSEQRSPRNTEDLQLQNQQPKKIVQQQQPQQNIQPIQPKLQQRPVSATPKSNNARNSRQPNSFHESKASQKQSIKKPLKPAIKVNNQQKQKAIIPSNPQPQQQTLKKNPNSVIIPEPDEIKDIPITEWVNQLYCPPPMLLDKKVYVHKVYNNPDEQVEKYVKPAKFYSVGIQTEFQLPQFKSEQIQHNQNQQDFTPKDRIQTQTVVSDNYQEDFESFVQSQFSQSQQLKQSKTPRNQPTSNRRTNSIQEAVEEDVISDIYSQDFEQISQSQTFKRSLSKKDDISDSYIPDFESISQSQQFRKK